jgi:hypothetical protein
MECINNLLASANRTKIQLQPVQFCLRLREKHCVCVCVNGRWTQHMNYFSGFSMLKGGFMEPDSFMRLHFPQTNERGCASKVTAAVFNIY